MSNETNVMREPAVVPPAADRKAANTEAKDQPADAPAVPDTGDLPILPEIRAAKFADKVQSINWRAALSTAGLAAFLAAVAGIGCASGTTMLKPSPATPAVLDKPYGSPTEPMSSSSLRRR